MGIIPTTAAPASDEVIDAIADIEMKRRETEKQAGVTASRSSALHRLQELLDRETEALRLRGPERRDAANVDAVTTAMERVKKLAVVTNRRPNARDAYSDQRTPSWRNAPRSPAENRGRRTMGPAGSR